MHPGAPSLRAQGPFVFIYGGLKGSQLLDDLLLADDSGGTELAVCDPRAPAWSTYLNTVHGDATAAAMLAEAAAQEAAAAEAIARKGSGDGEPSPAHCGGALPAAAPAAKPGRPPSDAPAVQRLTPSMSLCPCRAAGAMEDMQVLDGEAGERGGRSPESPPASTSGAGALTAAGTPNIGCVWCGVGRGRRVVSTAAARCMSDYAWYLWAPSMLQGTVPRPVGHRQPLHPRPRRLPAAS